LLRFITSTTKDYVIVVVRLFVCLSVSNFAQKLSNGSKRICMKFWMNKWLHFGGDADHGRIRIATLERRALVEVSTVPVRLVCK